MAISPGCLSYAVSWAGKKKSGADPQQGPGQHQQRAQDHGDAAHPAAGERLHALHRQDAAEVRPKAGGGAVSGADAASDAAAAGEGSGAVVRGWRVVPLTLSWPLGPGIGPGPGFRCQTWV
ncbi:hypothetical protein GCM10015535_39220 [Streptomyces gelaticus]|uniref:Uncharacterized protein n=1 Tax=Streptomyces gelaticus TaxID=285446 RepID=A0ABQ2W0R0_9ACTN|nr:hypothetical protein [Streptomyces gelaticus]GGV88273.1 hypothetical protein GCM10015535_39220 [Streptomyces gelaticus]